MNTPVDEFNEGISFAGYWMLDTGITLVNEAMRSNALPLFKYI